MDTTKMNWKSLANILVTGAALLLALAAFLRGDLPPVGAELAVAIDCTLVSPTVHQDELGQYYLRLDCVEDVTPIPVTPTPTLTATATITPTLTPTLVPTITPTTTVGIEPYPDAPECAQHDDRAFHTLWNTQDGCHYDHFHGDDPHEVDDLFGVSAYSWFGGDLNPAEISYPWQTFNAAGCMENECKHGSYIWFVRRDLPCVSQYTTGCVTDFRALIHADGTVHGAVVANHSVWIEARVCVEPFDPTDPVTECGIYRGGGWQGPARLAIDGRIVLDPEGSNQQRTFLHYFNTGNRCCGTWYNGLQADTAGAVVEFGDMWDTTPERDENGTPFTTPEEIIAASEWRCAVDENGHVIYEGCTENASYLQIHIVFVGVPPRLRDDFDPDGDGYADYFGYTDRRGNPVPEECETIALDCVPSRWEHVNVNHQYQFRGDYREYDILFDGEPSGWVEYPLHLTEE